MQTITVSISRATPHLRPTQHLLSWLTLVFLCTSLADTRAQRAPAGPSDAATPGQKELIVMTPFAVVEDPPGYQMLRTTTGTRLNTDLRDVPSHFPSCRGNFSTTPWPIRSRRP